MRFLLRLFVCFGGQNIYRRTAIRAEWQRVIKIIWNYFAAFSTRSHYGPLVGSDESYTTSSAASFSNDGTALKSVGVKSYDTRKKQGSEGQKYQGFVSTEQFQKLAQTLGDNDFSNIKDSSEIISDTTSYTLIVSYSGKTKTIKTSNISKDTTEIKAILDAFETLKNQVDWKQVN